MDATTADYLEARVTQQQSHVRFEVVDAFRRHLFDVFPNRATEIQVANNIHATIKRTLSSVSLAPTEAEKIDVIHHRLRPVWVVENGAEFPLGVFMFASPTRNRTTAGYFHDATLFDLTFLVDQARRTTFSRRVGYLVSDAIRELLREVGLPIEGVEESAMAFSSPVAYPAGTTRLAIINDLCATLGYYSLYFDNTGLPICRPVPELHLSSAPLAYSLGRDSRVIRDTVVETDDLWEAPNVWLVVSTSATDQQVSGSYALPADHPLSVQNRGYEVVQVIEAQGIESSAEAVRRARAAAQSDSSTFERVEFDSTPDPRHDTFDVVAFDGAPWREQAWTLTLAPAGPHHHVLRRIYDPRDSERTMA